MGLRVCVPLRCYDDVLVVAESSKAEPDAEQLKHFARGVGKVKVGWRGAGEKLQEVLELTEVTQLDAAAMAKARAAALKLEKSALRISKDVYGRTSKLEAPPKTAAR
jgi:hypothetical protein